MADISKDFALRAVARVLLELAVCAEGGGECPRWRFGGIRSVTATSALSVILHTNCQIFNHVPETALGLPSNCATRFHFKIGRISSKSTLRRNN